MSREGGAAEARHPTGLSWPEPPYEIARGLKLRQLIAGWFLVVFCSSLAVALLGGYFGMTTEGRALLVDTALSLGLGSPIEGGRIEPGACDSYKTTGRYGWSGHDCELTVIRPGPGGSARVKLSIDVSRPELAERYREAASLLGTAGIRWPAGVMANRWMQAALILIVAVFLGWLVHFAGTTLKEERRLIRAGGRGTIVPADLLYGQAYGTKADAPQAWRFSFIDARGRRRFARSVPGGPLQLDGVVTRGAALMAPDGRAWLILANFWPLALPEADAKRIIAGALALRAHARPALQALEDEPAEGVARLSAIEGALAGRNALRAYVLAWRLVWDYVDAATAEKALQLRNRAGAKLGMKKTWAALEACRKLAITYV